MKLPLGILFILVVSISTEKLDDLNLFDYHKRIGIPTATRIKNAEEVAIPKQRIVEGFKSDVSVTPYQAGILIPIQSQYISVCGASLISATRLITAAHCDNNGYANFTVVLGSNTLFSGGTRISIYDMIIHPDWNPATIANDLAVIRIPEVTFSEIIQPIALPSGSDIANSFVGLVGMASGFGVTSNDLSISLDQQISSAYLTIISNEDCAKTYGVLIQDSNICTSGSNGAGTCSGDSGGPLTVISNDIHILVGVTSFVAQGCSGGYPAAYTRITSHINWIESQ